MIDRYTVIQGLTKQIDFAKKIGNRNITLYVNQAEDMLELLKDNEVVEPKQVDLYGKDEWWSLVCVCPDCKAEWMSDKAYTHFCPNCRRPLKWDY